MIKFEHYEEPMYAVNGGNNFLIGRTEVMLDLFHYLNHLANLPTTVLLRGESGTGKELCAKALHFNGKTERRDSNFVTVNCAGIPSELLESELFGYVKGAFTGAYKNTMGKFEHADKGTILLDEIGEMSPQLQAKILRVLQEKEITKVGSTKVQPIDVRVIAATNRELEKEVKAGNFREDLFYRLNVVPVTVSPLRERRDDVPLIANYFVQKFNEIYGANIQSISTAAQEKLKWFEWKGNVRELENVIERAFVLTRDGQIDVDNIYFNSEMPKGIFEKAQAIEVKPTESKPVEDLVEILWFEKGVLPISPREITKCEGAYSYAAVLQIVKKTESVYVQDFGRGQRRIPLIYVTPGNAKIFFRDTSTQGYASLMKEVEEGKFNEFVQNPFKIYTTSLLLDHSDTYGSQLTMKRVGKSSGAHTVLVGNTVGYVITEELAHHFISSNWAEEQEEATERLKAEIREGYELFKTKSLDRVTS